MPAPTETSLIDAVNARDEPVGTVARGEALRIGASFRTVHIFLLNESGSLLLQRLAPTRDRHPDRWGSSVAAYLNSGESYAEAAERRLFEELALSLPLRFAGKLEMRDEHSHKFVSLFQGRNGTPTIREPDHISELAYWPLGRLSSAIAAEPSQFTPTFRELYLAFGASLG
jgi:isopentenyl-diphosphate delta-isomerase